MKVLVTDYTFPSLEIEEEIIRAVPAELIGAQCKSVEGLKELVRDADAVITQFAPVNADVIACMERARVIVRYGIGVDNVDLAAARQRQIPVCNVPDYCIDEVADHTLALMLAATRSVQPNSLKVRRGEWGLAVGLEQMRCLRDLTVGIVGFGRIGREVAARLAAFKCQRLVYDPMVDAATIAALGCTAQSLDQLLSCADIVTLHCPSTDATRKMLHRDTLAQMKRGSLLVNVGRGDLVDPDALTEALQSGHLSGAALDVFQPEPIPADHPILKMESVVVGAHLASASVPAVRKLRQTAAQLAVWALQGRDLPNVVNR